MAEKTARRKKYRIEHIVSENYAKRRRRTDTIARKALEMDRKSAENVRLGKNLREEKGL